MWEIKSPCLVLYLSYDACRGKEWILLLSVLTSVLWVHMGRVEAEVDEERNRHSELEPLHHVGGLLAIQGRGHVAPQDHALSGARRHKPRLLSHSVDT